MPVFPMGCTSIFYCHWQHRHTPHGDVWRQVKQEYGLTCHSVLRVKVEYKEIIPYLGFYVVNGKTSSKSLFCSSAPVISQDFCFVFFCFGFPPQALLGVLPELCGARSPVFACWLHTLFSSFSGEVLGGVWRNYMIFTVVWYFWASVGGLERFISAASWEVFLQPQNGSFIILKQLLELYLVASLRKWAFWVKACFYIVLQVFIHAVFYITVAVLKACLSSSRYFFLSSLLSLLCHPLEILKWVNGAITFFTSVLVCSNGRWQANSVVTEWPGTPRASHWFQQDFGSWKVHGAGACCDM